MIKVFVDGSSGTTGLRIRERLSGRNDLAVSILPEEHRKDNAYRKEALNSCDIAFLCLPDDAAREAVALAEGSDTVIIDTSTAHRTAPGWVYGFPEVRGNRGLIKDSKRIANPGCYASGFIALVSPLVENGVLAPDTLLSCFGISGYSGGGKKMIAEYEGDARDVLLDSPRMYGLDQAHKHLPEMKKICGLENTPVFTPNVAPYYAGMLITVPLFAKIIASDIKSIEKIYADYYNNGLVHFRPEAGEGKFLASNAFSGSDTMEISVHGNEERILLTARFDNLGKGASGAAIQNMNIALGLPEETGLVC